MKILSNKTYNELMETIERNKCQREALQRQIANSIVLCYNCKNPVPGVHAFVNRKGHVGAEVPYCEKCQMDDSVRKLDGLWILK
jgi:hypothetical protein